MSAVPDNALRKQVYKFNLLFLFKLHTGTSVGMQTMDNHLMQLIDNDKITAEAAYEKAIDKNVFINMLDEELLTV